MRKLSKIDNKTYKKLNFSKFDILKAYQSINKPTIIKPKNNHNFKSSCINCETPYCMYFLESELTSEKYVRLSDFPSDPIKTVCPLDCININEETSFPIINQECCIGCGLCVERCPVGAIYIDPKSHTAKIVKSDSRYYLTLTGNDCKGYSRTLKEIKNKKINIFEFNTMDYDFIRDLVDSIEQRSKEHHKFENLLIRNLLNQLNVVANIPRIGDVNIRLDVYFENSDYVGFGEIDFAALSLNTPRRLLEDIAILNSRYDVYNETMVPVIFLSRFPNTRSYFYDLIKDVKNVLEIDIYVVPLLALLILAWSGKKLKIKKLKDIFAIRGDEFTCELEKILKDFDDRNIKNTNLLTPQK